MSLLPDRYIDKAALSREIRIEPYSSAQLQPASYDVLLGDKLLIPTSGVGAPTMSMIVIDPLVDSSLGRFWEADLGSALWENLAPHYNLLPGDFILAHTLERITLPTHVAARIEGKSTLGRWGLNVHVTAGFIDPGFSGQVTLELKNLGPFTLHLTRHMPIAQISFQYMAAAADRGYKGKYQNQEGVVGGRPEKLPNIVVTEIPAEI